MKKIALYITVLLLFAACSRKKELQEVEVIFQISGNGKADTSFVAGIEEVKTVIFSTEVLKPALDGMGLVLTNEKIMAYRDSISLSSVNEKANTFALKTALASREGSLLFCDNIIKYYQKFDLEGEYEASKRQLELIDTNLDSLKKVIEEMELKSDMDLTNEWEQEYGLLEKEYTVYLEKKTELTIKRAAIVSRIRVLRGPDYKGVRE